MRVTIKTPLVVANTDASNTFGETYVVASGGAGATGLTSHSGIALSAGDNNPERIQIDGHTALYAGFVPAYSQGDVLSDVTGIVNYAAGSYEVLVTNPVTVTTDVTQARESTNLVGDINSLTYVSFNVENLSPANPASKFSTLATEIVNALGKPDIIGLEEVQDNDGNGTGTDLTGTVTAQKLIDAIVAAGGPTYSYIEIAPPTTNTSGGEPNGNIRNGYLYNPVRVSYNSGTAMVLPDSAYAGSRRPLIADFTFNGQTFTIANLHSTSRGGSDIQFGVNQPQSNAGDTARTAQATALKSYIDATLATDPNHKFIIGGDFNGYYYEQAIQNLTSGGAIVSLYDKLPVNERYSYFFDGVYQAFDYVLTSASLAANAFYDIVHYNAGFTDGLSVTDHDQAVAKILFASTAPTAFTT